MANRGTPQPYKLYPDLSAVRPPLTRKHAPVHSTTQHTAPVSFTALYTPPCNTLHLCHLQHRTLHHTTHCTCVIYSTVHSTTQHTAPMLFTARMSRNLSISALLSSETNVLPDSIKPGLCP
ncbi:hypothetical protein AAFF_G00244800 [Aldrovandia affinis]|uniref:Uncharacterized protein n=1 Tax=Aldrovandia affinis TaxID=143900 RepID=A0AAD7VX32_9TELE|nr:hypothetical protein AAFF_G00244800 [Aldrovandia affinis]